MSPSDFDMGKVSVVQGFRRTDLVDRFCSFVRLAGSRSERSLFNPENVYTLLPLFFDRHSTLPVSERVSHGPLVRRCDGPRPLPFFYV